MIDADCSPAELADELGMTLSELAMWAADQRNLGALERLARLADIRAQIVVSKYRANAAAQLIQIATSSTQSDLARKACVDLLNANLSAFENLDTPDDASEADASALSSQSILDTLERIGREAMNDAVASETDREQSSGT